MHMSKHIHLIGICGTAMASLAGMLKERGFEVTGSDAAAYPPMSDFLRSLGISVAQPFAAENLNPTPDLVVVGNAISRGNVELEQVLDQRIAFCSLPQLLHDEFLRGKEVLVVAGTHGKTTTTSMLSWIFESAGLEPSFLIGGIAENFGRSFQLGSSKYFIIEGDNAATARDEVDQALEGRFYSIEIFVNVRVIKLDRGENDRVREIVQEFGAFVEKRGIVFVAFDDEILAAAQLKTPAEILRDAADQE